MRDGVALKRNKEQKNMQRRCPLAFIARKFYRQTRPVLFKNKVLVKKWVGKYSIIYTASKLCVAMSFTV